MINLMLAATLTTLPYILPQTTTTSMFLLDSAETRAEEEEIRQEIIEKCKVLEDDLVSFYLKHPTSYIETIRDDYEQQYQKPYEELKRILVRLNDIKEYVPQEYLLDIDPKNNPTNTSFQVQVNLENLRVIQEIAEDNYQAAQEEAAAKGVLLAGRPSDLNKVSGVNYYNGRRETYFSSKVAYHCRTSEWLLDEEGFYRTTSGFFVVSASDMPIGTVFEGSKGLCCVLDSGCDEGITDYYVNW